MGEDIVLERNEMLINDIEAHAIARELATNPEIRELSITRCIIPNTSVMILANTIGNSTHPLLEEFVGLRRKLGIGTRGLLGGAARGLWP